MARRAANPQPHQMAEYDFPGVALQKYWPRLHQGDCEPFPAASNLNPLIALHPKLKPALPVDKAAEALQAAWRAYHRGDFQEAVRFGLSVGLLGYNVANKAANIHATYLETAAKSRLAAFLASARRAEELQKHAPTLPNAWYLHAQALGRYSQEISIIKALSEGLGSKIKASLDRTLALEPRHADAHIALGAYHAEIIDKIGGLVGGLTYGASTDASVRHFQKALKLNPDSAIARIEYANGLLAMFGDSKMTQATRLYEEAARFTPADAMERLDVKLARTELKD